MYIILKIVLIVSFAAAIFALITLFFCNSRISCKAENSCDKVSFRETMDLTGLPIVTFRQGENKLNFILDTGAVSSLIDSRILGKLQYTEIKGNSTGYGIDGKVHDMSRVGIVLTYKDKNYPDVFRALDMSASFDAFKRDYGVTVHGLLSSSFFERYKYVLNYNELVAYSII